MYRGIMAVNRDPRVRAFALEHLAQELKHLAFFDDWLTSRDTSALLPLWRLSGWALGLLAGLAGPRAVFTTVDAVEEFVVEHYGQQLTRLGESGQWPELYQVLWRFCADEDRHRWDALQRHPAWGRSGIAAAWSRVVGAGSKAAVWLARAF